MPAISLQELRAKIGHRAKSAPTHRFWGLYVHLVKLDTLEAAYLEAKRNGGAPGSDGETFEAIVHDVNYIHPSATITFPHPPPVRRLRVHDCPRGLGSGSGRVLVDLFPDGSVFVIVPGIVSVRSPLCVLSPSPSLTL